MDAICMYGENGACGEAVRREAPCSLAKCVLIFKNGSPANYVKMPKLLL
jgi:hypothetical protein